MLPPGGCGVKWELRGLQGPLSCAVRSVPPARCLSLRVGRKPVAKAEEEGQREKEARNQGAEGLTGARKTHLWHPPTSVYVCTHIRTSSAHDTAHSTRAHTDAHVSAHAHTCIFTCPRPQLAGPQAPKLHAQSDPRRLHLRPELHLRCSFSLTSVTRTAL